MNIPDNIVSWLVLGISLIAIFFGCAVVIKRFFIDKKYLGGSQFVGRQIYAEFQNADRKKNIDHVIYMEEEERQQDFTGAEDDETENQS